MTRTVVWQRRGQKMPRQMVEAAVAELGGIGSQGRVSVSVSLSEVIAGNAVQGVVVVMGI
jgi:hypothetical protein